MDNNINLVSGGVYQTFFNTTPCRVIAFDELEVFYEVFNSGLKKWSFSSNLKSKGCYYRTTPKLFLKDARLLSEQPLTEHELKTFRPDLPFRLCRNKQIVWTDKLFDNLEEYKRYADQFGYSSSSNIILSVPSITLEPFGSKGNISSLKSTLVTSISESGFSCIELLWLANNVQAEHAKHIVDKGVGIYRSGHEKKVPSFYIGGYYDKADSIPKEND